MLTIQELIQLGITNPADVQAYDHWATTGSGDITIYKGWIMLYDGASRPFPIAHYTQDYTAQEVATKLVMSRCP